MKLKVYRISLLGALIASLGIDIFFLVQAIINIINSTNIDHSDEIMFIIGFVLLILFVGLEIVNTVISFKNGSAFIKNLTYNQDLSLNRNLLYVSGGISILSLIAIVYFSLLFALSNMPFGNLAYGMKTVILGFFIITFVDSLFITLFPLVAKEDKSFK